MASQQIKEAQPKANVLGAKIRGNLAFAHGFRRIPAFDTEFTATFAGRKVGDPRTVPELDGWLAGWDEANLAVAWEKLEEVAS